MTQKINTPAFILEEKILRQDIDHVRHIADQASCQLLYSPKACSLMPVLDIVADSVDGFGCSSLYELKLVSQFAKPDQSIHLVSPLISEETLDYFGDRLGYVTMNSLTQWGRLRDKFSKKTRSGIRINPQLSFLNDPRYDPCRPNSKLGVPLDRLAELVNSDHDSLAGLSGLHFHTNCDETDFAGLLATVRHIKDIIPKFLTAISWVNMGGGYLFNEAEKFSDFYEAVEIFREEFDLTVFIEPGAGIVRRAGIIEARVHDLFESEDAIIAVLDTSVNHMSEVFEFQFEPDVLGYIEGGIHTYILAGSTCLAGDVFGEYSFDKPLDIGSKVSFQNMGAYTMSKAHRFNGMPLPSIYTRQSDGSVRLIKVDTFDEFARNSGLIGR